MKKLDHDQIDGARSQERKSKWIKPVVEELVAGSAEGSADITSDGPSQPS